MNRNVFLLIAAIFALVLAISFLLWKKITGKYYSVYESIPAESTMFFEISSEQELKDAAFSTQLLKIFAGEPLADFLAKADSLPGNSPSNQLVTENDPLIVFYYPENNRPQPVMVKKSIGKKNRKEIENYIYTRFPKNMCRYSSVKSGSFELQSVTVPTGNPFYYIFTNGLWMASFSPDIISVSLKKAQNLNINSSRSFWKVKKTTKQGSGFKLFFSHKMTDPLISAIFENKTVVTSDEFEEEQPFNYFNFFSGLKYIADWSGLDLVSGKDFISFNGISTISESPKNYLRIFEGQGAARSQAAHILPDSVFFFSSYTFTDKTRFLLNLDKYFALNDETRTREFYFRRISSETGINLLSTLNEMVDNEVIAARLLTADSSRVSSLFVIHTTENYPYMAVLDSLSVKKARLSGKKTDELFEEVKLENEKTARIGTFPFPSFAQKWLGQPFGICAARYYAQYGNYLFFGANKLALINSLNDLNHSLTLKKAENYSAFESQHKIEKSNINVYAFVTPDDSLLNAAIRDEIKNSPLISAGSFFKSGQMNWQTQFSDSVFYNTLTFRHLDNALPRVTLREQKQDTTQELPGKLKNEPKLIWGIALKNKATATPCAVINHNNLSNSEIILQDTKNNLVLVTNSGKIVWHFQVEGKILGSIKQIDMLKNNKFQYLFNTDKKLYVVDRNGKTVPPFPIKFSSDATAEVAVFDYEKDRNYRFFVPLKNKKSEVWDKSGKLVKGWELGKTSGTVAYPFQHLRSGTNDYVIAWDQSKVYILDRKGKTKVKTADKINGSKNPVYIVEKQKPHMIYSLTDGTVKGLYFDGTEKTIAKTEFGKNHLLQVNDLDNDGNPEIILSAKNKICVYAENGKQLFKIIPENAEISNLQIVQVSANEKAIGFFDKESGSIFLYRKNGSQYSGSPFTGTAFNSGKLFGTKNQFYLFTCQENNKLNLYSL